MKRKFIDQQIIKILVNLFTLV